MSVRWPDPSGDDPDGNESGREQPVPVPSRGDQFVDDAAPTEATATGEDGGGRSLARGTKRKQRTKRRQRQIIEWVILVAAALGIALVIKTFLFQAFYIPSTSMVPTLKVGDRVLVNKLSYHLHDVHRGDIVVFTAPPGTETAQIKDLVKRVVGLPGDSIEGRNDGHIYINGRMLSEPYLHGVSSKQFAPKQVPANSYFVLGDNRPSSKDSTVFGPISRSMIVGRVFVRIWPITHLGFL
jgi:signal peptidase I